MNGMEVAELWAEIEHWLRQHAPVTAAALRVPATARDFTAVQQELSAELPADLRAWWSCCDGTDPDVLAEVLPPFYTPYGMHKSLQEWRAKCEQLPVGRAAGRQAGAHSQVFHPEWMPIAGDGYADELVVDLRPGPLRGCVLEWEKDAGRVQWCGWRSIRDMLGSVHRALTEGTAVVHSFPVVTEDGRLTWRVN